MDEAWPRLDYASWRDTAATLQLWTQIVGKVRLALTPWLNHSWQVPLYLSARGLTTSAIPAGDQAIDIEFDFLDHRLVCRSSGGGVEMVALRPKTVAQFHDEVMSAMALLGVKVTIHAVPNEVADPIPFAQDRLHASYDADAARRFWRALVQAGRVFRLFRSGFIGKASPVHFFWGSFDLAATRFSGRTAPLHPGGVPGLPDRITREAYSHEVSSAGFWPGNDAYPHAAFYSYAYPEPSGFRGQPMPAGAAFDETFGEFILLYETVRSAPDPEAMLMDFLQASYEAAADCGNWDRAALECPFGRPGVPRPLHG
ncbi:hypothetical protein GON01_14390 [Sphingomonas sp. MAH-20]|uniref:Ava_C0101 and related proteins n=1 Tax=Sphingomonas horti TaxID=2682842 RepID=A0A6I4J3B2_9SPHN|nr:MULTISPECIES: DUF5996 family protein [Sphingomonas]MBA2919087.1 hypothetical protein [Sphingomonas sp. CGMCC 1.13658]MVO79119.1 hypothetical protein [Sphingomonas horti]